MEHQNPIRTPHSAYPYAGKKGNLRVNIYPAGAQGCQEDLNALLPRRNRAKLSSVTSDPPVTPTPQAARSLPQDGFSTSVARLWKTEPFGMVRSRRFYIAIRLLGLCSGRMIICWQAQEAKTTEWTCWVKERAPLPELPHSTYRRHNPNPNPIVHDDHLNFLWLPQIVVSNAFFFYNES